MSAFLLPVVAIANGCSKADDLPEQGISDRQLVRLDGEPAHEHRTERLRVLVAEFGMGLGEADPPELSIAHLETFGEHAAVYGADLIVLFDTPFAGPYVLENDVPERIAVAVDRYYRTLLRSNIPSRSDGVPLVGISGGALLLSEYPLTGQDWQVVTARPQSPFFFPPTDSRVQLGLGGSDQQVRIRDGVGPSDASDELQVTRSGSCESEFVAPGVFPICIVPPLGWQVLRHEAVADFAGLGLRALKVEFDLSSDEDSFPVAP